VVGQWQASGESQAGFCRDRALAAWQFRYWARRLAAPVSSGGRCRDVRGAEG